MSDAQRPAVTGFSQGETALVLGALDLAVRHLGAQLQQGGIEAAAEAAAKIGEVRAIADRIRQADSGG